MSPRSNLFRIVIFVLCTVCVLFGGKVIWDLGSRIEKIETAEQSDPLWIASRLQFELLRLNSDLAHYTLNRVPANAVSQRVDILWSRLNVMKAGKMAALLDQYRVDQVALESLEASLELIDPLIQTLPEADSTLADRDLAVGLIWSELSQYELQLQNFSTSIAQAKSQSMWEFRRGLLSLSNAIAYLGFIILGLALIVVTLFAFELRSSRQQSRELRKLISEVEASATIKETFMSVVSHELRTPLTSILGALRMLQGKYAKDLDPSVLKIIDIAHRNSDRLLALVNDILDAQALSEGKTSLSIAEVDLNKLILDTVEEAEVYARQFGTTFDISMPKPNAFVLADASRIAQVLSNLLSNAAKFSGPGSVVHIRTLRDGGFWRVLVADSGKGIGASDQQRIFTRFHQANPGTTGATKSSGLGLSISKQLVEMHGGAIGFESTEGIGTTFWFSVPTAPEIVDTQSSLSSSYSPALPN